MSPMLIILMIGFVGFAFLSAGIAFVESEGGDEFLIEEFLDI